jgi:hypothetical protein
MSDSLRNGLMAFAAAAAAVVLVSVFLVFATSSGDDAGTVGDATSVTPAVLADTATPTPSVSPNPTP